MCRLWSQLADSNDFFCFQLFFLRGGEHTWNMLINQIPAKSMPMPIWLTIAFFSAASLLAWMPTNCWDERRMVGWMLGWLVVMWVKIFSFCHIHPMAPSQPVSQTMACEFKPFSKTNSTGFCVSWQSQTVVIHVAVSGIGFAASDDSQKSRHGSWLLSSWSLKRVAPKMKSNKIVSK